MTNDSRRPSFRGQSSVELKIQKSLQTKTSLHFHDVPLRDIIRHIAITHGINIGLDTSALSLASLKTSIDVDNMTLRSAMSLLLDPAGLVYDIEDEVLKVTTKFARQFKYASWPQFGTDPRYFGDLMSHAPGLNTSGADVRALAEQVAKSNVDSATVSTNAIKMAGRVDQAARKLIEQARSGGWERVTFPAAVGEKPFSLLCDAKSRHVYSRVVSEGLREDVVCDGETLRHAYSAIGLASERDFSRFHCHAIASVVPWLLPPVEELARGADVTIVDAHTVAVVPRANIEIQPPVGSTAENAEQNPDVTTTERSVVNAAPRQQDDPVSAPVFEVHFVFGDRGQLVERRLIVSKSKKVVWRTVFEAGGTVKLMDGDGKLLLEVPLQREAVAAPELNPKYSTLVVLPMPVRSSASLLDETSSDETSGDKGPDFSKWSKKQLMSLILADIAEGNGGRVAKTIHEQFFEKNDHRDGLYVLLSKFPNQLTWEEDVEGSEGRQRHVDLRPSPEGSTLRQFVRQYISLQLAADKHSTGFSVDGPRDEFVQRFATAYNLYHRWTSGSATQDRTAAQIKTELQIALEFVASCQTDTMGWTLLSVIQQRIEAAELNEMFAEAAAKFESNPHLGSLVREQRVRALFDAGKRERAQQLFTELLQLAVRRGSAPRIAGDIRKQFIDGGDGRELWSDLVRECGSALVKTKLFRTAVLFSTQLRHLGDSEDAGWILDEVLAAITAKSRPDVMLLAVEQLRRLTDGKAEPLLDSLLEAEGADARLWRYASHVADDLGHKATALRRLEHAIQLEFDSRPDVIDVEKLRAEYTGLMARFESMIDAATTLEADISDDMFARIVRTADQWRSLEDDPTQCCHITARILSKLNRRDLAWGYLTTPLAGHSGESAPWLALARNLTSGKQVELANVAWSKAFEFEQTNPEILLGHAKMLAANGRISASRRLLKQIVDSSWQPRFGRVQQEARGLLP